MGILDELTIPAVHFLAQGRVDIVYGPPGTGKSTRLTNMIKKFVVEYGPDAVMATSFTVTAARSLAGMGKGGDGVAPTGLPERQVGTLHSMAFRALGNPDVALDPKVIGSWNSRPGVGHEWRITPDGRRGHPDLTGDTGPGGGGGDALLAELDMARSQLIPLTSMPAEVRRFGAAWTAWKKTMDVIDFVDMVEMALERAIEGERAPGNPKVIIADEAQDMTPLEAALVLAWGATAGHTVLALDDDQAIMGWRGGNAGPILALGTGLDGGPQSGVDLAVHTLPQSWRIPASVHAVAQTWIERCSVRRPKEYRSRDVDGQCYAVGHPIESMATAEAIARDAHAGRRVMVLAACEYMLRPLVANLKRLGVPFENEYRPAEPRWNPLRVAKGMATAERLYRYLVMDEENLGGWHENGGRARLWTGEDVRAWLPMVRSDAGLVRKAKSDIVSHLPTGTLDIAQVEGLFRSGAEEALIRATQPELAWLLESALGDYADKLRYPAAVARGYGPAALVDPAPVQVGTIHSVKGGSADVTYLSPSVSGAGWAEWQRGGVHRDHTIRQFYVGLTRARETCVVLGSSERFVPNLCPPEMSVR